MKARLLLFALLAASRLPAQYVGGIYGYGGLGPSVPFGGAASLTFVAPSGWGGSVSYNILFPKAKNQPSDFRGGSFFFSLTGGGLEDQIIAVSGRAVRQFPIGSGRLRLNAEAGLSVVKTVVPSHFVPQHIPPDIFQYANYTYDEVERTTPGLSLRCSAVLAIFRPIGLELGVFSNLNPARSCIGVDFMLVFGHVRDRL